MKTCRKCNEDKEDEEFAKLHQDSPNRRSQCKACSYANQRKWGNGEYVRHFNPTWNTKTGTDVSD